MIPEEFTQKFHELTPNPRTVLLLLLEDKTDDEIAAVIKASPATVRKHVQNLADHFGLKREAVGLKRNRRNDLVALATPYKPALTSSQTSDNTEQEQVVEAVESELTAQEFVNFVNSTTPLSSKAEPQWSNIDESTNQNQNQSLQTRNLELYQAKGRLAFVLSGTIDQEDKAHIEVILPHLQKFSRDITLTISKIQPERQMTLDEQLCQLISAVIQNPDGTPQQRQAMDRLLRLIPKLPGIRIIPKRADVDAQDVLNKALESVISYKGNMSGQKLRMFLNNQNLNLNNDKVEEVRKHFVHWFNMLVRHKEFDGYRALQQQFTFLIDLENMPELLVDPSLTGIDAMSQLEDRIESERLVRYLRQYIREDPEGKLRNCQIRKHPECNCQELAERRLLKQPPDKWREIAEELKVPVGTVAAFWKRICEPQIKEIARNLQLS